jgi:hypothetical protein
MGVISQVFKSRLIQKQTRAYKTIHDDTAAKLVRRENEMKAEAR